MRKERDLEFGFIEVVSGLYILQMERERCRGRGSANKGLDIVREAVRVLVESLSLLREAMRMELRSLEAE